jgi:DNA invertase Pin-like site-specific DNA recombinase
VPFSKTIVFERCGRGRRICSKTPKNVSQNSFLIPFSQKLIMRTSLEMKIVATTPTKRKRSAPRKTAKRPLIDKPKRHAWTRRDGEIHRSGLKLGYARVSTLDQNLALQRDALKEAGCDKIFIEQASGVVADRPALHEALEYARAGDTLIVWKLDRLARSMKQLIETVERLRVRGIGFRSLTEAVDTTTAQGVLIFHLFSALAEFERALIRERTRAGLDAATRAGRTGGRPAKLTDDDLDVARTLLVNPDITVAEIADRLGVSPATLYRYLPAARTASSPSS